MTTLLGNEVGAPADLVDAPPAAPPLVSLLSSARVEEVADGGWINGIAYLPEACDTPDNPYWWSCPEIGHETGDPRVNADGTPGYTKDALTNDEPVRFRPFDVYDAIGCTSLQWRAEDWRARARRAFEVAQSSHIERELWEGDIATLAGFPNDYLTNSPTIVGGGALGYARALAELEQAVADVTLGRAGATIHAVPRLVSLWTQNGLVTPNASGRQLRTALGTLVVPGAGYTGTGESLADADTVDATYAYVTGIVTVRLGPIRELAMSGDGLTPEAQTAAFDTSLNDFVVRIERPVVYSFDPCLKHGVLVDLTGAL